MESLKITTYKINIISCNSCISSLIIIGLLYLDSIDVIVLSNLNVFFTITMFSGAFALCISDIEIDHNGGG